MNLKSAFAGLSELRDETPAAKRTVDPSAALRDDKQKVESWRKSAEVTRAAGKVPKSRNPDFEQVKVYIPKELKKKAWRKWEDSTGEDLSDLVIELFEKYLKS